MNTVIDLTKIEFQGSKMHESLTKPGTYVLPFKLYKANNGEFQRNIKVEVIATFIDHSTLSIVVTDSDHDYYYIFYYNSGEMKFKPNFEPHGEYEQILNWIDVDTWENK